MTTPRTHPTGKAGNAQEAAKQALVDQAQELGFGYGPAENSKAADIGEIVEQWYRRDALTGNFVPAAPPRQFTLAELTALLIDRDELVRALELAELCLICDVSAKLKVDTLAKIRAALNMARKQ